MKTDRQTEILEVAIGLIGEKGIQGLTIKNISTKIGISEPAIYRHFDSKIDILNAILDTLKTNSHAIFSENITNVSISSLQKIEIMFVQHFKFFIANPALASVVFAEELFKNEPTLTQKIKDVIQHNDSILTSLIKEGQKAHEIRNDMSAENFSTMIMGTLRLFVKKWQLHNCSFDLQQEG